MPIPPISAQVLDPVFKVLNSSRLRMHQQMPSLAPYTGTMLRETEASTQQAFNNAYRRQQAVMANAGSSVFEASIVIQGIPPVSQGALDPATECYISWTGCNDGLNSFSTPALPSDLMTPLWMSERWNGSLQPFPSPRTPNMLCQPDGLSKNIKINWNRVWQWRGQTIYYPGSLQTMDFWIYYQRYLPDIVDVGTTPWFQQDFPIMRGQEAMSCWLCREFCMSMSGNPDLDPDVRQQFIAGTAFFDEQGLAATRLLVSPDKKRKQRTNYTRLPFAGGGSGGGAGIVGNGGIPAYTGG